MASSSSYQSGNSGQYPCPHCSATGTITDNNKIKRCPTCGGSCYVSHKTQQKFLNAQPLAPITPQVYYTTCPVCSGTKQTHDPTNGKLVDCELCEATGAVEESVKKKWEKDNGAI